MKKFLPNKYFNSIYDIDFNKLKAAGIKVVASDLDNTLVPHYEKVPDQKVYDLVNKIKQFGLEFVILSNNKEERVKGFADALGVDYYFGSKKPLKKNFLKIFKKYNVSANQVCLIGDQIMTDVWGANRLGVISIYVEPLAQKDIFYTKINRIFERRVKANLTKKNLFKDGEFYE